MILAIDFDGVIHNKEQPLKGKRMGEPIEGAKETIDRLRYELGAMIIVHSVWATGRGVEAIAEWMSFYEIHYDEITNLKPKADIYLDDKAVKFTTWADFAGTVGLETGAHSAEPLDSPRNSEASATD
jgi:hypothetical protein